MAENTDAGKFEPILDYDPIKDEAKKMSIVEFQFAAMEQLLEFTKQMYEAGLKPLNEEQKVTERTFNEWMGDFRRWASW